MNVRKFATHRGYVKPLVGVVAAAALLLTFWIGIAQTDRLILTQTAEYDIGFKCPVTATFNPDFTRLWVLMYGCVSGNYSLHAFDAPDWSPVTLDTGDFGEQLAIMDNSYIPTEASAMVFTRGDTLDFRYQDGNTSAYVSLAVDITNGTVEAVADAFVVSEETMNGLVPDFAGYPEFAIYNADHTVAAVPSDTAWIIIDMNTQTVLFDIQYEVSEGNSAIASFSPDGTTLYMAELDNPDDFSDYTATLTSYSLPEGVPGDSLSVPSAFLWVSPDRALAVALLGEDGDALAIVDLTSGEVSPPVDIFEAPQRVLRCLNRDSDLSDLNYMSSGKLYVSSLNWLPDSSGFVTVNSYARDGAGAGGFCAFNFSRLREYTVETGT